jgi:ABC-2 type transport system ATP-binding protein
MQIIAVERISKRFGAQVAVDDVSFCIEQGELFGLLGPNGAGKTTTLRIILDIFKPDSGAVSVMGGAMNEAKKDRVGYMPEERGLYQDIPLERCLVYLAELKGVSRGEAHRRVGEMLAHMELAEHRHKRVKELSKGMQQKAQLIATLAHRPGLVIVDEPFSGLDPVNTQMVKDLLRQEQNERGVTIVMCTHQMNQVEALCDRLVLIDKGRVMLYGALKQIRQNFSSREVLIRPFQPLPPLDGVEEVVKQNGGMLLRLSAGTSAQQVLRALVEKRVDIEHFEVAAPSLDEIFIQVVKGAGAAT